MLYLVDVCGLLIGCRLYLVVVRCLLFVACRLSLVGLIVVCYLLFIVGWVVRLIVVRGSMFVVCCLLPFLACC